MSASTSQSCCPLACLASLSVTRPLRPGSCQTILQVRVLPVPPLGSVLAGPSPWNAPSGPALSGAARP